MNVERDSTGCRLPTKEDLARADVLKAKWDAMGIPNYEPPSQGYDQEGIVSFEWWNSKNKDFKKKLTVYLEPEPCELWFLCCWGPHIWEEMTDGVTYNGKAQLEWLFGDSNEPFKHKTPAIIEGYVR